MIDPVEAKVLREAFKQTVGREIDPDKSVKGDEVCICSTLSGGPKDPVMLTIRRGGVDVAHIPITPGVMKRLKGEMRWWKSAKSGAGLAFRHGNRP